MVEPQPDAPVDCRMISPQFVVPDVLAAAEYYRDVLGFRILGYFLDPPVFATVARDSVEIQFGRADGETPPSPNETRRQGGLDAYIWVNDVHSLHTELKARGAKIIEAPELTVYKCYEMVVEDNFGFHLCFSVDMASPAK
jgi:catechol 2,3-dioxygenase-like lactoylglutathione lyase family enzyme